MSDEKSRAEFEAAFREKYGFGAMTASANADAHQMFYAAEWAWQASRAALVVELPPFMDEDEDWPSDCWNNAVTHCARSMHAAGIKTIGETRPPQWSGWACQYPGKMPRLYGDLAIAKLNCDSENGDQLIFLSALNAAGITVKDGV